MLREALRLPAALDAPGTEPVALMDAPLLLNGQPLYTRPQREWVGLTDEEISDLWCKASNTDFVTADTHVFARAIEARLKEKNAY